MYDKNQVQNIRLQLTRPPDDEYTEIYYRGLSIEPPLEVQGIDNDYI